MVMNGGWFIIAIPTLVETNLSTPMTARVELLIYWKVTIKHLGLM